MKRHDEWNAIQGASKAVDVATRLDRMISQPDSTLVYLMRALRKAWLIRNSSKRVMDFNFGCVCSNFDPPNRSYTSSIKKHILNHEINQYCILFIYDNHMFCIHYYRENYTINEWCLCLDDYWWLLMILDDSWCLCLEIHSSLTFSSKDKPSPNRHGINWSPLIHIDYGD